MTIDDFYKAIARLVVENYTYRDLIIQNQQTIQEQKKRIEELEEPPPPSPE